MISKIAYGMVLGGILLLANGCAGSGAKFAYATFSNRGLASTMGVTQTKITGIINNVDATKRRIKLNVDEGSEFIYKGSVYKIIPIIEGKNAKMIINVSKDSQVPWDRLTPGKRVVIICREDPSDNSLDIVDITVQ